jgi:hypothetical protein
MEDTPASMKRDERNQFKQKLKGVAVNDSVKFHAKNRSAATLHPVWRLSMSLNKTPDDLAILPPPTSDWTEKSIMLATSRPAFLPSSDEERAEWRAAFKREMPAFLYYLLYVHEIQPCYRGTASGW